MCRGGGIEHGGTVNGNENCNGTHNHRVLALDSNTIMVAIFKSTKYKLPTANRSKIQFYIKLE